ncbi:hypothetical protein LSH36_656g01083 [Paralvinella palmiformis]|uniref:C-type lectin domain-containing protein n=1 Tax=Paralvinella palmiformis TaxID=53620 RepID=A0AAD9MWP7_9ANNE|nr:hypothetical protein LSH36_656g01083 [Paralvinella palmiformis]
MHKLKNTYIYAAILWMFISCSKLVVIKFHGLQPDNITNLNDDLIATCSRFATDKHQYTQIFKKVNCSNDRMSVTLIGQDMNCTDSIYVVGLTGSDAGKANNKWKTCLSRWQTTTDDNVDWCIYDCTCTGGCEELMVLRWPNILTSSSFTLCDISYHCNGYCSDQSVCYIYGEGSWDEGIAFCQRLHPNARMIKEMSAEEGSKHIAETVRAGYVDYWIGGRRPPNGGTNDFYWNSSHDRLVYTKWLQGQPYKGSSDADCIIVTKRFGWGWDDSSCLMSSMYMCKVAIDQ